MYLITPTLLNSFDYYFNYEGEADVRKDFLRVLSRVRSKPTEAMQKGIDFENEIYEYTQNSVRNLSESESLVVQEIGDIVNGGMWQLSCKRDIVINDNKYLLYGRCDVVKFDTIYDIKFTSNYDIGKYYNSAQHLIYLYCMSNLSRFTYLISDGKSVWREDYFNYNMIQEKIKSKISDFIAYLENDNEAKELFYSNWVAQILN